MMTGIAPATAAVMISSSMSNARRRRGWWPFGGDGSSEPEPPKNEKKFLTIEPIEPEDASLTGLEPAPGYAIVVRSNEHWWKIVKVSVKDSTYKKMNVIPNSLIRMDTYSVKALEGQYCLADLYWILAVKNVPACQGGDGDSKSL